MTPERVLSALYARTMAIDVGRPDPLQLEAATPGEATPANWRERTDDEGNVIAFESWPAIRTALGKQTRAASQDRLTDIASDSLLGIPKRSWLALQVAIGIDGDARGKLAQRLERAANIKRLNDHRWPRALVRRRQRGARQPADDYIPDLVELALMQFEDPHKITEAIDPAAFMAVSKSTWYRSLRAPSEQLSAMIWSWYHAGLGHIESRLRKQRQDA